MHAVVQENDPPVGEILMKWDGCGTAADLMALGDMYNDYWKHLATWSQSNQGLPLCQYVGTQFKLYRTEEVDWLFYYSTTELQTPLPPLIKNHPLKLYNSKERIVVWSRKIKGRGKKAIKIWIPPGPNLEKKWMPAKEAANEPLFKIGASLFTIDNAWGSRDTWGIQFQCKERATGDTWREITYVYFPARDEGQLKFAVEKRYKDLKTPNEMTTYYFTMKVPLFIWGYGHPSAWYKDGPLHLPKGEAPDGIERLLIKQEGAGPIFQYNTGGYPQATFFYLPWDTLRTIVANGPMTNVNLTKPCNITFQYKSYWKWGGNTPVTLRPAKPGEEGEAYSITHPEEVGAETITNKDLDEYGFIKPKKFRWLTGSTPNLTSSGTDSSEEEEKEELLRRVKYGGRKSRPRSEEKEETETDNSSSEEDSPKRKKTKVDRRLLRRQLLHRLRRLGLKPGSTSSHGHHSRTSV